MDALRAEHESMLMQQNTELEPETKRDVTRPRPCQMCTLPFYMFVLPTCFFVPGPGYGCQRNC